MKNLVLSLLAISFATIATQAAEPLLLEPLSPAVLSEYYGVNQTGTAQTTTNANGVQVTVDGKDGVSATYNVSNQNTNMVPQNDAAAGKPVKQKRTPRVRIETKQRSQSNSYWNAGGKGTKSFF